MIDLTFSTTLSSGYTPEEGAWRHNPAAPQNLIQMYWPCMVSSISGGIEAWHRLRAMVPGSSVNGIDMGAGATCPDFYFSMF